MYRCRTQVTDTEHSDKGAPGQGTGLAAIGVGAAETVAPATAVIGVLRDLLCRGKKLGN